MWHASRFSRERAPRRVWSSESWNRGVASGAMTFAARAGKNDDIVLSMAIAL